MEGAHEQVHRDHSVHRQSGQGRAEHLLEIASQGTGEQRHDGEGWRSREGQAIGRRERSGVPAGGCPSDPLQQM